MTVPPGFPTTFQSNMVGTVETTLIRPKASAFHNSFTMSHSMPQHATACHSMPQLGLPRFIKVVNDPDRILDEEQVRDCDNATACTVPLQKYRRN